MLLFEHGLLLRNKFRSRSSKAAAQLMERYQEAQQRILELDRQLCELHHDKKAAREQIAELKEEAQVSF